MNYNSRHLEAEKKKRVIASLVLGIVSVVFTIIAYYFPIPGISMFIFGGVFFIALIGIILGVIELKTAKKKVTSILGIILCIITLIFALRYAITLWKVIEIISS